MAQSDQQLPQLLATDLDRHFKQLVLAYQHRLYTFALRQVGSSQDAEDIVQEAFIRAYYALGDYPTERVHELETLICTLPQQYREAINLFYFEDLSYREIAELLNQPIGTVKSNLHRGTQLLRKTLETQKSK